MSNCQADIIVVLEQGKVIESGSHQELMRRDSLYGGMYRSQWGNDPMHPKALIVAGV
jgi:ATP-binding cassette subfamily B protein